LWNPAALIYVPYEELANRAFDPRWLVLYDDEQYQMPNFPYAPFDPKRPIHWTTGRWLDTGEPVAIPALATYMNFSAPNSERFGQTTSNGLAAGASLQDATLRALYELIERDAFMLFWLARRPATRIAPHGCNAVTLEALLRVQRLGARTELFLVDAGTKHPTVVCVGLGDGQLWPGVTIGLGTHADIDVALQKAVLEHGHFGTYMRRLMQEGKYDRITAPDGVLTALDHALYYMEPARASALTTFQGGTEAPASLTELRAKYRQTATVATCVARLRDAGIRAAAVDVTSPDVALSPLRVVRAFGTYMQPIHFGLANRRLKNPRLQRLLTDAAETCPHPIA
jgi:ribosomal protein S12 methylthiotransferase accessory factor